MRVFCIIGDQRVRHSKLPELHMTMLRRYGIAATYVPFTVTPEQLEKAISGFRAFNIAGGNIIAPYKEKIMPYLDELSEVATAVGAVNTIVRSDDKVIGYNTDFSGFMECLKELHCNPESATVCVYGTGCVAKAIIHALKKKNAKKILLLGRNMEHVYKLSERFGVHPRTWESVTTGSVKADILINASSVSSQTEAPQIRSELEHLILRDCKYVLDVNIGRKENIWQEWALRMGAKFIDGVPMLSYQARRSFFLWTGIEVERGEFWRILEELS